MKSRNLMGIFALASCVMLAGCGEKPHEHTFASEWSSNETEHWHAATCEHTDLKAEVGAHVDADGNLNCDVCEKELPAPEAKIVIHDLPAEVTVGDTIDLKDYIKTKDDAAFDVNFDDDSFTLVDVDGTKVTAAKEGDVSFVASCGGEDVEATFSILSVSRKKFLDYTEGVGYNYATWYDDFDYETEEYLGTVLDSVHNDEYVKLPTDLWGGAQGGIAHINDHYYFFDCDDDFTTATALPGYVSSNIFKSYNAPIELNDELFDTVQLKKSVLGFETEALVLNDSEYAYSICAGIAGVTELEDIYGNVYEPTGAIFFFDYVDEEQTQECMFFVPMISQNGLKSTEQPYQAYYISTAENPLYEDVDDIHIECVQSMIDNKEVPEDVEYGAANTAINSFVTAESYTVSYEYGWFDDEGTPYGPEDYPSMEDLVFQDCADSFVNGVDTIAVTDSAIADYIEDGKGGYSLSKGYMDVESTIYRYSLMEDYYAVSPTSYESISELTDARFGFLEKVDGIENPLFPSDLVSNVEDDVYTLNVDAQNALMKEMFLANSTLSGIITKALDPYYAQGRDLYSFFEGYIIVESDKVTFEWLIDQWEDNKSFVIDVTLENAGSTVVPADIIEGVRSAVLGE